MEIIRGYKVKYLDQVLKRKLTKYWLFWRFCKTAFKKTKALNRPFNTTPVPNNSSPSPVPKSFIRTYNTYIEEVSNLDNTQSTPVIHGPKFSSDLFNQIRQSVQSKASTVESKNSLKQETKSKAYQKQLFEAGRAKHKRNLTQPDFVVVSSRPETQLFKHNKK